MNLAAIGPANAGVSADGRIWIKQRLTYFALLCVFMVTAGAIAYGQNASARKVTGMVTDGNGAAIAGAAVRVAGPAALATALTTSDGQFSFLLPASVYSLTVQADGFSGTAQTIDLAGGDRLISNIVLQIAPATATVTVSDDIIYNANSISSATKTFTLLRDVPQSVTIIKSEQIRDQMMSSVADVVRYVPGVTAHQGENNRDDLVIRGNRSSADLYRDGVRDDVQYFRDLYNLERVETIKGPNAMAFGRGGGGGVINRVTKEAAFSPVREFTAQAGSFHNRRFTADIQQPFGHRVAFRVNGVYENSASFRQFVGLKRFGINPTITIVPDNRTHITIGYEYARDRRTADRGITPFHGVPSIQTIRRVSFRPVASEPTASRSA